MISIIVPTYNRAHTLSRSLDSVSVQTYTDLELIVVDDGSTDETEDILNKYRESIANMKIIRHRKNRGVAGARNTGIRAARGEMLAFLDSDDAWYPYHLEEAVRFLEESGCDIFSALWDEQRGRSKHFVGGESWFKDSLERAGKALDIRLDDRMWVFDRRFYEYIIKTCFYCFPTNSIVLKRHVLEQVGEFDEELEMSEDMDLWYRILRQYPLVTSTRPHFVYHYGSDNLYAYYERESIKQNYKNASDAVRKRVYRNLINKVEFYKKLNERVLHEGERDHFDDLSSVLSSIDYNIVVRCLTILLLIQDQEVQRYCLDLAGRHARSELLKMFFKKRNDEAIIEQYFCDD